MDPITLIFAAVAAFFMFRLVSVLGTRTGAERRPDLEAADRAGERTVGADRSEPSSQAVAGDFPGAEELAAVAPDFDPADFLAGAKAAYDMVVTAIAEGEIARVEPYLSDSVAASFRSFIEARAARGETARVDIVGVEDASIVEAGVRDGRARIAVAFKSDQVRVTRNAEGEVVAGDPARIDAVRDRWTFERDLGSRDPNWTLVATGGG